MENGVKQKQQTGNVLDVLLGRKKPSVLKKENKEMVSLSDAEENDITLDKKLSKRILHTVRQHPPKKIPNPYTKGGDISATGKILDDSVSEPLPTDGRKFINEYLSVPNSHMKPKRILPSSYNNPQMYNRKMIKAEKKRKEEKKLKEKRDRMNKKMLNSDPNNNDKPLTEEIEQRLQKELMNMTKNLPMEIVLDPETIQGRNLKIWKLDLKGPKGTSYYGDRFNLEFKFGSNYPKEPPEVTFKGNSLPEHRQVTKDGHISIPMLGKDWNSTFSVRKICTSLISMLLSEEDE